MDGNYTSQNNYWQMANPFIEVVVSAVLCLCTVMFPGHLVNLSELISSLNVDMRQNCLHLLVYLAFICQMPTGVIKKLSAGRF